MSTEIQIEQKRTELAKKAMIEALEKNLGIVTKACRETNCSRSAHYRWMEEDPDYKEAVDNISDVVLDFAETSLYKQIKAGKETATIFFLKTKGRHRGYIEKQQLSHELQTPIHMAHLSYEELKQLAGENKEGGDK